MVRPAAVEVSLVKLGERAVNVEGAAVGVASELFDERLDERFGQLGIVAVTVGFVGQEMLLVGVECGGDGLIEVGHLVPPKAEWECGVG